jgi:hypothetical protein
MKRYADAGTSPVPEQGSPIPVPECSGTGSEMLDAGVPMPALSTLIPIPSYVRSRTGLKRYGKHWQAGRTDWQDGPKSSIGIQDGRRDWDDGQARVELTKQTSTDSWNRQAGKVSGTVRARNKTESFKYVIQIFRDRYVSLFLTFIYSENLKSKVS